MKRFMILPLLAASMFAQSGGQFVSVITVIPASAWKAVRGCAVTQLPDGTNVIYAAYSADSVSCSLDTGVTPAQLQPDQRLPGGSIDGIYNVTLSIANVLDVYPAGYYEVSISFGTQSLCDHYVWGTSKFTELTFPCPSPRYLIESQALPPQQAGPAQGQNHLILTISNPGWPLYLKDGSVKFTPQPWY